MASPDDHHAAPAASPSTSSTATAAAAAATCPRCGANGASFSKSQWRKRPAERKCRACVEAVLGGPSPSLSPPTQPSLTAEAAPSSQQRKKRKRGSGENENTAAGEEFSPVNKKNAQPYENEGKAEEDELLKDGRKKSKYFTTTRPTKREDNSPDAQSSSSSSSSEEEEFDDDIGPAKHQSKTGSGGGGGGEGGPGTNDGGRDSKGSDDDAPGKWSPLHDEAEEAEDAPVDAPNNGYKTNNVRKRIKRARERALGDSQQHTESENDDDDDDVDDGEAREESLEAIKRHILGRPVRSMYDVDPAEEATAAASHPQSNPVMDVSAFADGATVADRLRQDLSCPICHDRLYRPVSLMCGHSFCRACVAWWLARTASGGDDDREDDSDDGGSGDERGASSEGKGGTCPTCREPLPSRMASATTDNDENDDNAGLRVNTALQAVTEALYGAELHQRRLAEERDARKARGGERDGMHDRGCEEVEPLPDEDELDCLREDATGDARDGTNGWRALYSKNDRPGWREGRSSYHRGGGATILIRRNVVLDENDQRYQLSLGMTRCAYLPGRSGAGVVDVQLCLLAMEEDEVDDSGFPAFVADGDDDEALICAGNERVHTLMEASARIVPASALTNTMPSAAFGDKNHDGAAAVRDLPLSRGMIGRDGAVRFRIDVGKALEGESGGAEHGEEMRLVKLRFRHADTGAVLELRLPSEREREALRKGNADDEIEFGGVRVPAARDGAARYAMDDRAEDEEDDAPNEYEEDGFLVHGSQDSEEEELGSDDEGHPDDDEDDDGQCEICDNGGDLLVCDGAGRGGGCGRMYHVQCIGRTEIPPGDWICNSCAYGIGISVGLEGHEFEPDDGEGVEPATDEPLVVDDSDDDEDEVENDVQAIDAATNDNALVIDDSDDEVVPVQKKGGKRKILEMPESDSDSE